MKRSMTGISALLSIAAMVALGGCIQRTLVVDSEPQGALVYLNDVEVGRTPTRVPFTFYGVYDVRLAKEGYQTLQTSAEASPPWYDTLGPDLFAEMAPWTEEVVIEWKFELQEARPVTEAEVLDHARQLRALLKREAAENGASQPGDEAAGE